jgi:hypothetical protein
MDAEEGAHPEVDEEHEDDINHDKAQVLVRLPFSSAVPLGERPPSVHVLKECHLSSSCYAQACWRSLLHAAAACCLLLLLTTAGAVRGVRACDRSHALTCSCCACWRLGRGRAHGVPRHYECTTNMLSGGWELYIQGAELGGCRPRGSFSKSNRVRTSEWLPAGLPAVSSAQAGRRYCS